LFGYPVSDEGFVMDVPVQSLAVIPNKNVLKPSVRKRFPETWIRNDMLTRCL